MIENDIVFGKVLRELRQKQNITQEKLAEMVDITTGAIGQLERGEMYPSFETLKRIIEVLKADANVFFFGFENKSVESVWFQKWLFEMGTDERKRLSEKFGDLSKILSTSKENN